MVAIANFAAIINNGSLSAGFLFSSNQAGLVTTSFRFFGGLTNTTHNYTFHIHEKFLHVPDCTSVGGHFNPTNASFGTPNYPKSPSEDWTLFEVGDLAGKFIAISFMD